MPPRIDKKSKVKIEFPSFCDYSCSYAEFAAPDAVGACRKDLGVWCTHFNRYNNKNNKCLAAGKKV